MAIEKPEHLRARCDALENLADGGRGVHLWLLQVSGPGDGHSITSVLVPHDTFRAAGIPIGRVKGRL